MDTTNGPHVYFVKFLRMGTLNPVDCRVQGKLARTTRDQSIHNVPSVRGFKQIVQSETNTTPPTWSR